MPTNDDKSEGDARRKLEKEIRAAQDELNSILPTFSRLKVDITNVVFWEGYWEMHGTYRKAALRNAISENISFFTPPRDRSAISAVIHRFFELREKMKTLQEELDRPVRESPAKRR
ncbi:MAG TPA: hypothetical protein VGV92_01010 [Gammaproteobacteria bacterium]|nr:hypothetical protein [Gammaproteobacteria bacterium]